MSVGIEKTVFVLSLIGALLVLEGIPYFAFPNAVKRWALMLLRMPEKKIRLMGLALTVAGLVMLFALRYV